MQLTIHPNWEKALTKEFKASYFKELITFVTNDYAQCICYPPEKDIFQAFNSCALDEIKVVVLGQDPYHGKGQAHGLCFSVPDGEKHPPSLANIFKEIATDTGKEYPVYGNLQSWAEQGVFLLNATLTVRASEPGSHQKQGWEQFTDAVIQHISHANSNVVFMLWGGYAKKKSKLIDHSKHLILSSGHPSPLSANRGYWFGNKHFSQCNTYLQEKGKTAINWSSSPPHVSLHVPFPEGVS
ncbi:uracil-DNA glycosylase [Flavobacteriaceae bacterium]|nr:uracil-DNA glycosylase [Flavobacteriaceae bacterium]MDA9330432.1 uracil-DNA glycosylase [Flavobacteriaceae bacterium]